MKSTIQKGSENKFYVGLLATTIILFVVFFTSKLWLYDDNPIMQSPFNTEIEGLNQTALKLNKWEYNPGKELMEVTIETIHKGSDVVKPTFTFTAREKDSVEEYPVKVVYKDDTNIVLQIKDVPETYRVIGLFIFEHRDEKVLKNEAKEKLMMQEGSHNQEERGLELTLPKPAEKILVGDYRKIKLNNKLVTRDAIDYQIENVEREIKLVEKQIMLIVNEKIPLQDELIKTLEDEIELIENDLEYQTDEEKDDSLAQIQGKKEAIEKAKEEQNNLRLTVKKHVDKREKLQEKLDSIRKKNDKKTEQDVQDRNKKTETKDENETKEKQSITEKENPNNKKDNRKTDEKSNKKQKEMKEQKQSKTSDSDKRKTRKDTKQDAKINNKKQKGE